MRAVFTLLIGLGCLATAAGWFPPDREVPYGIRFIGGMFGVILLLAGMAHARLRLKRRAAYRDGTQMIGTIRVEGYQGEDGVIARLAFEATGKAWRMTVDANALGADRPDAGEPLGIGVGYAGEDGRIYALDWEGRALILLSPGKPIADG